MIKSPRQKDILRRLALVGEGPAAFYRDACAMLDEEARFQAAGHLVAHCLREIESSLRSVLLPRGYSPPAPCDACGVRSERHKDEVRAILAAYGFAKDDAVAKVWLRLCDQGDDLSLHRLAHRNALRSPRGLDGVLVELWGLMEDFLDAVLDRFEGRFAEHMPFIDELLRKEQPGQSDVRQFLTRVPQNDVTEEYFFSRASARWLVPLRKKGVFTSPPKGRRNEDERAWYPAWAASKYLVRLSEQADEATRQVVGEVALDIVSTENTWVKTDIVRLCLHTPLSIVVRIAPTIAQWLSSACPLAVPELAGRVAHRLWQGGQPEGATTLLRALLATTSGAPSIGDREVDVDSCYDAFEFEQVVRKVLPDVVAVGGLHALGPVCDALERAANLRISGGQGRDDGCAFRSGNAPASVELRAAATACWNSYATFFSSATAAAVGRMAATREGMFT